MQVLELYISVTTLIVFVASVLFLFTVFAVVVIVIVLSFGCFMLCHPGQTRNKIQKRH